MTDRNEWHDTSPELSAAVTPLMHAASEFAIAATRWFALVREADAAAMSRCATEGLAVCVIEIELSDNPTASFCMDVGSERRRVVTVPTQKRQIN